MNLIDANRMRFDASRRGGHYESWFLRANHPKEKRAFWLRYTIFRAEGADDAKAEPGSADASEPEAGRSEIEQAS